MKAFLKNQAIDASDKILGRLASQVAVLLRGKHKPAFLPNVQPQEEVTVFNTDKIKVSGKKMRQKMYTHHTGYPGGLRQERLAEAFERDSRWVLREAVLGMLPKNKTRNKIIKNLKLFKGEIS